MEMHLARRARWALAIVAAGAVTAAPAAAATHIEGVSPEPLRDLDARTGTIALI